MEDKLPDKVVEITSLVINRNKRKHCTCGVSDYVVDSVNREVICKKCGVIVDPYEAIYNLAKCRERLVEETNSLLEQRRQIDNYKPWLVAIKKIEQASQRGKMIPTCPHCEKGIFLDELTDFTSAESELARRIKSDY